MPLVFSRITEGVAEKARKAGLNSGDFATNEFLNPEGI
jgi:hypothetical protein